MLYEKSEEENNLKQQRRASGKEALTQYAKERKRQQEQRRTLNKKMEEEETKEKLRLKGTTNQWDRIVSQVEINATNYVGQADVGRMRQAMVARKNDITKGGSSGNKKFTI